MVITQGIRIIINQIIMETIIISMVGIIIIMQIIIPMGIIIINSIIPIIQITFPRQIIITTLAITKEIVIIILTLIIQIITTKIIKPIKEEIIKISINIHSMKVEEDKRILIFIVILVEIRISKKNSMILVIIIEEIIRIKGHLKTVEVNLKLNL